MEQSITIKIAGTLYPLKATSPEAERLMRIAADSINKKLADYDAMYPSTSLADKLSFVAMNEAVSRLVFEERLADAKSEAKKLQEDLDTYLKDTGK